YMDDFERGSVWEESLIFAPHSIRFVCLSATISNVEELGAWLREIRGPDMVVIKSNSRPVPLHHRLYTARSGAFEAKDLERVRKRELERAGHSGPARARRRIRSFDGKGRGGKGDRDARESFRHGRGRGSDMNEAPHAGPLLDELTQRGLMPVLVFSFSRKDCE